MTMPATAPAPAAAVASASGAARPSGRDRYLDLLRALALVRVVAYHEFGWAWLTVAFPSMGVMFALAGSLMARSLERPALKVIRSRLRRLLPPLWVFGALVVAGMVAQGWGPGGSPDVGRWWAKAAFWVVPLSDPPYSPELPGIKGVLESSWADQVAVPLWYLRAYLWFVLLSPLLLKAFRRLPWPTLLAPLGLVLLLGTGVVDVPGRAGDALLDFAIFGSCWLLGFAHHDGLLTRIPRYVVPSIAPFILLAGLWWALGHQDSESGYNLDEIPIAQAIWSFGFVLLLLHLSPSWTSWPPRLQRWNGVISLLNARAMTVYLWHNVALMAAIPLLDPLWQVPVLEQHFAWLLDSDWLPFLLVWPLLAICIVLVGWVEDVAAKRRPRLFPWPRRTASRAR
ncbi:acyltransferase family protein [Peterkaempfera bronchialis]|uniref:Acyltransferase n=1 Tax=Peterkaempfera bronchialis TaxID=2126346 RepID=A0A345ST58_9ACTN|nr:acyltransferase [Peterkaempfera bronchialis]AXI76913.1 acyltransferase [Peterkaempfera bronchialis]